MRAHVSTLPANQRRQIGDRNTRQGDTRRQTTTKSEPLQNGSRRCFVGKRQSSVQRASAIRNIKINSYENHRPGESQQNASQCTDATKAPRTEKPRKPRHEATSRDRMRIWKRSNWLWEKEIRPTHRLVCGVSPLMDGHHVTSLRNREGLSRSSIGDCNLRPWT